MTNDQLTAILAERVMGWGVVPDRFMMGDRRWLPRWRFQPAIRLGDAYRLLERLAPKKYTMGAAENGSFFASVSIADVIGEAHASTHAEAITLAVARVIGLEV